MEVTVRKYTPASIPYVLDPCILPIQEILPHRDVQLNTHTIS